MNTSTIVAFLESLLNIGVGVGGLLSDKKAAMLFSVLALGKTLIAQGDVAEEQLKSLTDEIKKMVEEGREPTQDEFDAMKARYDAAYDVAMAYLAAHGEADDTDG